MNIRIIQSMLSRILLGAGAVLLLFLLLSLYYGGPVLSFLIPPLLSLLLYLLLRRRNLSPNVSLTPREGTAITALSWIAVSLLYAIPYICSGTLSPLDGLVESVSGLTGTGATVINDLSPLPPSILFFRAMTHWLGGLGIIVIFVALFPPGRTGHHENGECRKHRTHLFQAPPPHQRNGTGPFLRVLLFHRRCHGGLNAMGHGFLGSIGPCLLHHCHRRFFHQK